MQSQGHLRQIPVDSIDPNPDNPRLVFRQEEMDQLLVSVKKYGVQVPITVFPNRGRFTLIDGERRWKTSKKLNLRNIPAIILSKPSELENLLMMFNIHSLREQWDLFTIANKLTKIIEILKKQWRREPNEIELSEETGLSRSYVRRCRMLIELPEKYKKHIRVELEKPKSKQKLTEDFFIEMESSLKTVRRNFPELLDDIDTVRDNLIEKYRSGVIRNLTDFRQVGKLATAPKNVNYSRVRAAKALSTILKDKRSSIADVYESTVGVLYGEKRLISTFNNVLHYLQNLTDEEKADEDIRKVLEQIKQEIENILKDG
jgi:ParB/RepB/Spo0J family partition protein